MKLSISLLFTFVAATASADYYSIDCDPQIDDSVVENYYETGETGIETYAYSFGKADETVFLIKGKEVKKYKSRFDEKLSAFVVTTSLEAGPFSPGKEYQFNVDSCGDGEATLSVFETGGFVGRARTAQMRCVCSTD